MARAFLGLLIVAAIGVTGFYTYHHVGCPNGGCSAAVNAPAKACCSEQATPCCTEAAAKDDACTGECPGAAGKCCLEKETKETKVTKETTPEAPK